MQDGSSPPSPTPASPSASAQVPPLPTTPPNPLPAPNPPDPTAIPSTFPEFRLFCASLLKRLHDPTPLPPPHVELRRVCDLLRLSTASDSEPARVFLREFAVRSVEAVLRRHYSPDAGDCDAVVEVVQQALALVAAHLTATTGQPMPPLPQLSQFPPHLFDVPHPPATAAHHQQGLMAFPVTAFSGATAGTGMTAGGTGWAVGTPGLPSAAVMPVAALIPPPTPWRALRQR